MNPKMASWLSLASVSKLCVVEHLNCMAQISASQVAESVMLGWVGMPLVVGTKSILWSNLIYEVGESMNQVWCSRSLPHHKELYLNI